MPQFPLIVFDLDGTLIDSRRDLAESANAVLEHCGLGALAEETVAGMVGDGAAALVTRVFEAADIKVSVESDMDGWLKYHYAFIAPTTGVIFSKGGDLNAVATDAESIHQYCRACREAGDILRKVGYRRRQPPVFNLYYWLPRRLEPLVFKRLFGSRSAEVRFGLHAPGVVPELLELAEEFSRLKAEAGAQTPTLDALLASLPQPRPAVASRQAGMAW